MGDYHLAQVNVARMKYALEDAAMSDFVSQIAPLNALADRSPGFVWRLQSAEGNAVYLRAFDDPMMLVNLSVWRDFACLHDYVYKSVHVEVVRERRRWFEQLQSMHTALWWIPRGHFPAEAEAREKLEYLNSHGSCSEVFDFKHYYPPPAP